LMLVAMTYNIELFIMVCLGLSAGFAYFNYSTIIVKNYTTLTAALNPEPCCAEDDDSESLKSHEI